MNDRFFISLPGRLIQSNAAELFVAEEGSGPVVLLIHGLGWSHAMWRGVIAKLSGQYRVIAGDTRGHGASEKSPGPYTMEQLAADWLGILDAAGVERCAVIGLSQGGMVAMLLAAMAPDRIAALGLLGTACHFPDAAWAGMQERGRIAREMGARAAAEHTSRTLFSPGFASQNPSLIAEFIENRLSASAAALGAATASLQGFDVRSRLSEVRVPVLIMHGTEDTVISAASAAETGRLLPQAETVMIEGAGHILPVERPDIVGAQLQRFLLRHYPPSE